MSINRLAKLAETYEMLALARRNVEKNTFNSLKTFQERVAWLKANGFAFIKAGSSRAVFLINNRKVIKLAFNKNGIIQNRVEFEKLYSYPNVSIFPKVFDKSPDNSWIEVELVRPCTNFEQVYSILNTSKSELNKIIKLLRDSDASDSVSQTIQDRLDFWQKSTLNNVNKSFSKMAENEIKILQSILNNSKLINFFQLILKFGLTPEEFEHQPDHFGIAGDGRLVITDAGLSPEAWENMNLDILNKETTGQENDPLSENFEYGENVKMRNESGKTIAPLPYQSRDPANQ